MITNQIWSNKNVIFQLCDYILMNVSYLDANKLIDQYAGYVNCNLDPTTGEHKKIKVSFGNSSSDPYYTIDYYGLHFEIYESDLKIGGKILLRCSLPKVFNGGYNNFIQFGHKELDHLTERFKTEFSFQPLITQVILLEFGIMYQHEYVNDLVLNTLFEFGKNGPKKYDFARSTKKMIRKTNYMAKHYVKSKQMKKEEIIIGDDV